ncbi:amidohydrolase family protein [Mesorhizobium humile]|uniref:Amidohydrolase family protein n=1 Tax=Mesorhizobium humile TaxID=3072313 RepID=A0ABU4YCH5_9HYPH|nr:MULTISPECIES: amidohydrolase family protein [unclassified Mesorhizobium]MDX8458864.1 amidohydrolase family protein [Mesorhizobium sp. VK2D]MDX8484646.1 amidohydrolase family protein [Mesorhizobium sp. VK2B]
MADYFPFDPDPRPASRMPPPGATDCQFHVFGPAEIYPVRPGAAYEMPQATIGRALAMHEVLGIERGVIVQPTTYGTDHSALLDALAEAGPAYRGCVIAAALTECPDAELERLTKAGVRGARFNFLGAVNLAPDEKMIGRAFARARELGWHVKIQPGQEGILDSVALYENADLTVVIDHMGRPDLRQPGHQATEEKVVELLRKGNFWVLLSNGHKISQAGFPWHDVLPVARAYIEAAPDRVLWASDWPHPLSKTQPPNDGALLDLLFRYAGDEETVRRILVDNPARLIGFDQA